MKKLSIIIITGAVILSGCSKSYFDINQNPNSPSNASVDLVLASALKTSAGFQVTTFQTISEWMGYWSPSGSYALSSSDGASYKQTTDFYDAVWQALYRNLEDYDYVERTATANNQYFYIAAAKTMKAYIFKELVDMFNDVPYTQALKGTTVIHPAYDKGKDIYEALSTELGTAVTLFQRGDATAVSGEDILYGPVPLGVTSVTQAVENGSWAKFANSLRLRLLIQQTSVSGRAAYIQTEINKILANGAGFLTADAAVNPGYSNSSGKANPIWGFSIGLSGAYTQDFWRAAKYTIDFCVAHNDPRYKFLYAPIGNGTWVGTVPGSTVNPAGNLSSTFGAGILKSVGQSAVIFEAAESYLLQAEAGMRGFIANTPATLFNTGVQASFTYLGAGSAAAYTSQPDKQTNYSFCINDAERLACIIRQKWMAFNSITPLEAWNDWRRTGYPADILISVHPNIDQPPTIPIRILYPTSEYQTNLANVSGEGTINHHTSKIWWMP